MNLPLYLRPEAEADVVSAQDWYERQRSSLGDEFVQELANTFDRIIQMPEMYAVAWEDVRSCRLRRFPYIIYYRILHDRIEVLAVLHANRDPSLGRSRG